jgi:hypothetical protein
MPEHLRYFLPNFCPLAVVSDVGYAGFEEAL